MQIKYMYDNQSLPHITILSEESDNTEAIFNIIKKNLLKKFILFSPGLGIFYK